MKKKRMIIIVLICVLLVGGVIGWKALTDYSRVLDANWGISLPFKARYSEIYEKDSETSFHGDGVRYHMFSYKYEDYIDLMFAWGGSPEHETLYYPSVSDAAEVWLDTIDVPEEHRPDYSACFSWNRAKEDNSEIIFFWNPEVNRLYIVENFI